MIKFESAIFIKIFPPLLTIWHIIRRFEKKIAHFEKKVPNFRENDRFFQKCLAIFSSVGGSNF